MSTRAKDLFASGNYSAAELAFVEAATAATNSVDTALQLSNAAQCALKLKQYPQAVEYARRAVEADVHNAKAHFRLATALSSIPLPSNVFDAARRCCDIAMANTCAAALLKNTTLSLPGFALISSLSHPVCQRAARLLHSVMQGGAALIKTHSELCACTTDVVVVDSDAVIFLIPASTTKHLVGLDSSVKVICAPFSPHALFVEDSFFSAWRLKFVAAILAMVCAEGNLSLIDCTISNHPEHGVLCAGSQSDVLLAFCEISRCVVGVEIREGARAHLTRCKVSQIARQGISCYGGAHSALLEDTVIEDIGIEGVQCIGPRAPMVIGPNVAHMQPLSELTQDPSSIAVADLASSITRRDVSAATLRVTMVDCTLRRCGGNLRGLAIRSGVTVDQSAQVTMRGCLLQHCGMAAVFVKGGSDASIQRCRIEHGACNDDGVRVDINYDGQVRVENCAFVGKLNRAIVDSLNQKGVSVRTLMRATSGAVSAAIIKVNNKMSIHARKVPSIRSLRANEGGILEHLKRGDSSTASASCSSTPITNSVQTSPDRLPNSARRSSTVQPNYSAVSYRRLGRQGAWTDYPIGNTYGRNILEGLKTRDLPKTGIRVLLAACGDIRNVVETIVSEEAAQLHITFILNDLSTGILARNIVLLELATRLWPMGGGASSNASSTWLYAWGSIALKATDRAELDAVIIDLAARKLPTWLNDLSTDTLEALVHCWSSWASCQRTLEDVRKERNELRKLYKDKMAGCMSGLLAASAAGLPAGLSNIPELNNAELLKGRGTAVNPTLLSVGRHEYNVYESSIFRALNMKENIKGHRSRLINGACEALERKGPGVAAALHNKSVRVVIMPGDLTTVLGDDIDAAVADMSNALDYLSMPACMFTAARCLRRPGGVIFMHSMKTQSRTVELSRLAKDAETCTMHAASLRIVADALGLRIANDDDRFKGVWSNGSLPADANWCFETVDRKSQNTEQLLDAMEPWYQWPTVSPLGRGIAAWPSTVLCLQILAAADANTKWSELVQRMCNASGVVEKFRLQLKAHAALVDNDDAEEVVVASIVLKDVEELKVMGYHRNFILRFESSERKVVHYYDVFDRVPDRGVCEFLVCRSDLKFLRKCKADLQAQSFVTGEVDLVSDSTNLATLPAFSVMTVRDLTAQEKGALTSRLIL